MPFDFKHAAEPSYLSWNRGLKIRAERGTLSVALTMVSPSGERISLGHDLQRADVVSLAESLRVWLASPDSYPPCREPGCREASLEHSDYCGRHQD